MKITKLLFALFLSSSVIFLSCAEKDSDIQTKVNEKLSSQSELSGISSSVDKGVVTLTGEVNQESARADAEAAVKDVKGVKSVVNNTTVMAPPPPPAMAPDSALTQGVADATKDFPTVTATVNNGEITLTGSIERSNLDKLMQTLNTLNASKINNQLTIK